MAKRIFMLRGVPDKEADDVRALLSDSDIPFYETPRGNYGISMAALWLSNDGDEERARRIIEEYQSQFGDKPVQKAGLNINWRMLPWGILLLLLLFWMLSMGLTR
jgi:hypothetical protein